MKFYKTIVQVEILSEKPVEVDSLENLNELIIHGDCSGLINKMSEQSISKKELIDECSRHHTDPSFFGVDVDE